MDPRVLRAFAKINLTLSVRGRRPDGFHELHSVIMGVDLADQVEGRVRAVPALTVECSVPSLSGPSNLAFRAAHRLAERLGRGRGRAPAVHLRIRKNIPVGAGLGGGSSDAAVALKLCNQLWEGGLTDNELADLGAEIGSDVPLFFHLPSAVITGRGERVASLRLAWSGWVLLAFVGVEVSTPAVYAAWKPCEAEGWDPEIESRLAGARDADAIQPLLYNDLEPAVFRVAPRVREAYEVLRQQGLGPMGVSGAGSTLFRLFNSKGEASRTAARINELGICSRVEVAAAPVGNDPTTAQEQLNGNYRNPCEICQP